jgi:hypothetical protein
LLCYGVDRDKCATRGGASCMGSPCLSRRDLFLWLLQWMLIGKVDRPRDKIHAKAYHFILFYFILFWMCREVALYDHRLIQISMECELLFGLK